MVLQRGEILIRSMRLLRDISLGYDLDSVSQHVSGHDSRAMRRLVRTHPSACPTSPPRTSPLGRRNIDTPHPTLSSTLCLHLKLICIAHHLESETTTALSSSGWLFGYDFLSTSLGSIARGTLRDIRMGASDELGEGPDGVRREESGEEDSSGCPLHSESFLIHRSA